MENNKIKRALIFGSSGQDGFFITDLLEKKGYIIRRVFRTPYTNTLSKNYIGVLIKEFGPDEIYNFAGVSNVFNPWENLDEIFDINMKVPQYILESILSINKSIKFFQASSCLMFGRDIFGIQNELTPFNPIHPYGISKLAAHNLVSEFRQVHNIFACSGIFFNHESERRGENFFSKKITRAVARIHLGLQETVKVGNLNSYRDYGYAKDYVEAAYLMMQNEKPVDYVIGTGKLITMMDFAKKCFDYVDLDYENYVDVDSELYRENDTTILKADTGKIKIELGWEPKHNVDDIVKIMMDFEINLIKNKYEGII